MSLTRVKAALESLGLREQYLQNFVDNDFDDEMVDDIFSDPTLATNLQSVIRSAGHRIKFQKAFTALPIGIPSTQNILGIPSVPLKTITIEGQPSFMNKTNLQSSLGITSKSKFPTSIPASTFRSTAKTDVDSKAFETELIDLSEPQPIQIMDFKESGKQGVPSEIVFHESKLQEILSKTTCKRVAVLAIAGPCRKGKSFFLNFVLRYLNSLKTNNKDWMGWRQPNQGLKGFTWRNSTERVTTGIWMWSEPFTMKSKNEDVDLLIMDTQGVFDEHTTQREWSILVGLGLLTSSCLIFNIMSDLQEDYLQVFENFLSFGLMALNEKDSRTPFQRLVFLIRDWNIPGQYPYGSSGGKKFIDAKLDTKDHHKASHRRIRQQLKECFEDIHCFLLPHPGEKVLALDFDGSAGKSETFAAEIEKCILELMNPLKFPAKKINGNFLTGPDLLATFQLYCELFNSDEVPNPESVFEIASKSCNAVVIKKCIDTFSAELLALSEERPFVLESELEKLRIPAENSCVETFNKSRKMGDENMIREAEQLLRVQIESAFEHVKQKNAVRLEQVVTHATEDSIKKFDKLMNEQLQNRFLSAEKFLSASRKAEEESLRFFTTACGTILPEAVESLRRLLESRKDEFQNKNTLMKRDAEKVLEKEIQIVVENYAENVSSQVTAHIIPLEQLEKIHESAKKKAIIEFEELEPEEELLQNGMVTLQSGIDTEFRRIKKEVESFSEKIQLQGKSLVMEAVAKFKAGLKTKITLDKKQFHENQEESLKLSKSFLKGAMPIDDNELLQKLYSDLDNLIPDAYNELLQIVQMKEEELKSSLRQAKDNAAKDYSLAMEQLFPQNDQAPIDAALLESSHIKEKSSALQALKEGFQNASKACQGADENLLVNVSSELEEDIGKAYKSILEKNQLRKDNNDSKAQVYLAEVKDSYVNEMKQAIAQITEEAELRSRQSDVKQSSITKLKEKIEPMVSSSQVIQKLLEDLNSYIDEEFEGTLELFRMKKEEDEYAVKSALLDARMYYNEEIEKHFQAKDWLEQAELEKLHKEIGEAAIERSKKEVTLTSSQEKQLREAMLNLKRSYEEKNIMRMPRDSYAIGIDLGTTYSCVAVCIKGKIKVIPCDEKTTIPSYVAFSDDRSISVGDPAKDQAFRRPESTIFDAKRLIGRKFSDNIVKKDMELWPFEVIGENDQPMIKIPGHPNTYRPEQISAHVLAHLKKIAEEYLNKKVTDAIVTVPAYFSDSQRQATKDAAQIAGLNAKILNEPTSAAIAYELHRTDDLKRNVLIFDLGGGTFDVAVLQMVGGNIDVKAIGGDTHLGGEDFDNEMVKHIIEVVKRKTGKDLGQGKNSSNPEEKRKAAERLRRIRSACEKQKRLLSSSPSTTITIDRIDDSYDLNEPFTRKEFEDLNMSNFKKCIEITDAAISDAKMSKDNIEDIVLIGGSTRIPKIRELLKEYFNGKALNATINADEAVAFGAAVQAALEYGKKHEVSKNVSVSDVTPLSLGVELFGGDMSVIIPRNTSVPCSKTSKYSTARDEQTSVSVNIYEGEESIANRNNLLGKFVLGGIPSAPQGQQKVDCTMEIDSEGILHVKATCSSTGGSKAIKIEAHKGRMSQQDIHEAKANAEDFNW